MRFFYPIIVFFISACTHTRPNGDIDWSLLSPGAPLKFELGDILKQTVRSARWNDTSHYVKVVAEVRAPGADVVIAGRRAEDFAYKRKLNVAEAAELKRTYETKMAADDKLKTCFGIHVYTDDRIANDAESWHATLFVNGAATPLKFSTFRGVELTSTNLYVNAFGLSSYDTKTYFMNSEACAKNVVDLTPGFQLVLDPRYRRGVEPVKLSWTVVNKPGDKKSK